VNGILIAAMFAMATVARGNPIAGILLGLLPLIGIAFSLIAFKIFEKHRDFYTEMLLRKTLLERELGFYETAVLGHDLSFPWKVEQQFIAGLADDPDQWLIEQRFRKGTASSLLRYVYFGVTAIFAIVFLAVLFGFCRGLF
jgi:hypothetical protein